MKATTMIMMMCVAIATTGHVVYGLKYITQRTKSGNTGCTADTDDNLYLENECYVLSPTQTYKNTDDGGVPKTTADSSTDCTGSLITRPTTCTYDGSSQSEIWSIIESDKPTILWTGFSDAACTTKTYITRHFHDGVCYVTNSGANSVTYANRVATFYSDTSCQTPSVTVQPDTCTQLGSDYVMLTSGGTSVSPNASLIIFLLMFFVQVWVL